jgi:hypothetical protein
MRKWIAVALLCASAAIATPVFNNNFSVVTVDGNTPDLGYAASVLYVGGVFHLWYRTSIGDITGLNHATSADGLNFTTTGSLSFSNNPFPSGTPPFLYYENVAQVGSNFEIYHWTYFGGAGSYPAYDYNISVTSLGSNPNTLAGTHVGAVTGLGSIGFCGGPFGEVNGNLYCQSNTGQELGRAPYTSGSPPSTAPGTNWDFSALFTSLGIPTGYINNHSDVISASGQLQFFFTVRDGNGNRFNQQVYFSVSNDNGLTWSAPIGLFTNPTLNTFAFGANFAHADAVVAGSFEWLYISSQDGDSNFILAATKANLGTVPEPGTFALLGLGVVGFAFAKKRFTKNR